MDWDYGVDYSKKDLDDLLETLHKFNKEADDTAKANAQALLNLQYSNAKKLHDAQMKFLEDEKSAKIRQEHEINERLINMGFEVNKILEANKRQEHLETLKAQAKEAKKTGDKKTAKDIQKQIKDEYKARTKEQKALDKEIDKAQAARAKKAAQAAQEAYGTNTKAIFGIGKQDVYNRLIEQGYSADAANKALKDSRKNAVRDAMYNFAKQLEGTMEDIARSQSAIDTRMQGSSQRKWEGSYWRAMSQDVIKNVGMSPLVKQADVVSNLKTLVGKGIAFNVEERAFLETVSEKIATTFEATDSTLLKLVRIQQADTTAARLGMESALTAFLNNMYETTEYMTEAAASIRQNLYEASALMGATEATAFEYQVQKWMGSLYSVGFSNTSGLSAALGKLAAGDISGITEGGYGNLLIMAANRAGLSVSDMLAQGLDDSQTNQLMQAMVEYLGGIYAETKNSKVVAQQFANVYGLTASDLKAAANLYGSTNTIAKNNLGYSGMLGRLNEMANSMYSRTSTAEMMSNLFENFKYATANTMGNSASMYAIYKIASMLKDTTGGIEFSLPLYMGTGTAQTFNVADILRTGVIGASLLGGIGNMLAGLGTGGGFSGSGMLRAFGIDNNLTTITRGTGTGISAITSGTTVSEGGFHGNSASGDVYNKTMSDTAENTQNQIEATEDTSNETKLSTVDEHILNIYNFLEDVSIGTKAFTVKFSDSDYGWLKGE